MPLPLLSPFCRRFQAQYNAVHSPGPSPGVARATVPPPRHRSPPGMEASDDEAAVVGGRGVSGVVHGDCGGLDFYFMSPHVRVV